MLSLVSKPYELILKQPARRLDLFDYNSLDNYCLECMAGARSSNLGKNMLVKLKAVYSLTEKLYAGSLRTLVAASAGKKLPQLSKMYWINYQQSQANRITEIISRPAGAIAGLRWAKAYQTELDPKEMAGGFLQYNDDGSVFSEANFAKCVKEMRSLACQLAQELDLKKYQPASNNTNT